MSIQLTEVTKWFGDDLVVNQVSLEINDGELFVLLGSSGSGKSTILRLIAGLITPTSGRIALNGKDVTDLPVQSRGTGYVFQNYSVFRHMTVADNIEFGLRIRKISATERRQRSAELLDLVGLAGLGARYADQLSGGQQQRVALARALAYSPAVLLLDEPFGALDVQIRAQLRSNLKEIQRQLGVTTILVTHDQDEAFELADRIGVIDRGHLLEVGTPQDLYHRPRTEAVAAFVGGGNVLVGRETQGQIQLGSVLLPFPPGAPQYEAGAPVRILFRPESVHVQTQPFSSQEGLFILGQGQVVRNIFSGDSQRVVLEVENLEGARPLAPRWEYGQSITRIEALLPSKQGQPLDDEIALGQRLWLGIRHFHVLTPGGIKVLVCLGQPLGDDTAAIMGCKITQAVGGSTAILSVVSSADEMPARRAALDAVRQQWAAALPRLETHLRQGDVGEEILREVQTGHYDLVVLGSQKAGSSQGGLGSHSIARQVLLSSEAAVMLVSEACDRFERMLICTATGEPGKSDVLFGARLARNAKAHVTVLHVLSPQASSWDRKRVERHLSQAQSSLLGLGIQSDTKISTGPVLETITQEVQEGDIDLVVIGAPDLHNTRPIRRPDLASQIAESTQRPVLIVPMLQ